MADLTSYRKGFPMLTVGAVVSIMLPSLLLLSVVSSSPWG